MPILGTITLRKAKSIISKLPEYFIPVGSFIRNKKKIGDIDLISLKPISTAKKYLDNHFDVLETYEKGKREYFFVAKIGNQKIHFNIWYFTKSELPYAFFGLSYPKMFVARVRGAFKRNGYKLNQYGLYKGKKKINQLSGIKIKDNKSFFQILKKAFGYNYEYRTPAQQELKGKGIDFSYLPKKIYQGLANIYRSNFCDGKARPLEYGELHPLCANYEGPGTRIDLHGNYPPYNNIDKCARMHDYDYDEIFKIKDEKLKAQKVRDADEKFLQCVEGFKYEEPYYSIGKAGISGKAKLEDFLPSVTKNLFGNYFGQDFKLN